MKTIASLSIPQMFTAYAQDKGSTKSGLHHIQYFCENCDQPFSSAWGRVPGSIAWVERGSYFYCPYCGTRHEKHVVYLKQEDEVPYTLSLSIKEFKHAVTFEISGKTSYFDDYLSVRERKYTEIFKFDIQKQKVFFSKYHSRERKSPEDKVFDYEIIELGNPFQVDVLEKSILSYFFPRSLANSEHRSKLSELLKILRETVHAKLEKKLGYKIKSMYVSPGQVWGIFLFPILNIAYRVSLPDAPNLPDLYRTSLKNIHSFLAKKMVDIKKIDQIMDLNRQGENLIQSIIRVNSLPDKPFVRRTLHEDPLEFGYLSKVFSLCSNYDHAKRMYMALKPIRNESRLSWSVTKDLFNFLRVMKLIYGEIGIVRLVEGYEELKVYDCVNLYKQLYKKNKKAIRVESVRLRDLHDWMSLRHKKQKHENIKFNVPKHIVKRLTMQKEQLRFFLPEESMQLLEAGHELHNCVASYGTYMKDHKKWIVLVADDKGKLMVCMEIDGNELVQAKIDCNKPVAQDKSLNEAVIAWAKERGITIKTRDINIPREKKQKIALLA